MAQYKNEEKASGISPTKSGLEDELGYLIGKDASDEINNHSLNKKDNFKERRLKRWQRWPWKVWEPQKKQRVINSTKEPKWRLSVGNETVAFLWENSRPSEIELRKAQLELEARKHNDMSQKLQQQQQQQMLFQQLHSSSNLNTF